MIFLLTGTIISVVYYSYDRIIWLYLKGGI